MRAGTPQGSIGSGVGAAPVSRDMAALAVRVVISGGARKDLITIDVMLISGQKMIHCQSDDRTAAGTPFISDAINGFQLVRVNCDRHDRLPGAGFRLWVPGHSYASVLNVSSISCLWIGVNSVMGGLWL